MEKVVGLDSAPMAPSLTSLAGLDQRSARYADAEPLFHSPLAIDQKAGPAHRAVAALLNNLGQLLRSGVRPRSARRVLGPDYPDVARSLNHRADLHERQRPPRQGRLGKVEPMFRGALATGGLSMGPDHPRRAFVTRISHS